MTSLMQVCTLARSWRTAVVRAGAVFLRDAGHGLLEVGHNSLALFGLLVVGVALFASSRADVRHAVEAETLSWLQARQEARLQAAAGPEAEPDLGEPDAIQRATASDPRDLSRAQASVALWLSRRYHVAPEPVSRLVQEAWTVGALVNLDPTLILAVMAVESSFNPFAQSPVGAQGLMQVMTKLHDDKYEAFGGSHAAFDPVTNLRVGVQVLKECIARSGGLEAGLRAYVGAANSGEDGGYAAKVLAQQGILRLIASGGKVRTTAAVSATPAPRPRPAVDAAAPATAPEPQVVTPADPAPAPEKIALLH
ncbi:MAG TPA: lytic transglycosylase domain-containing protein [Caldimonas sp.]|jgi:soluble lytic murein transglycosylase-like protein|nr:lytic transglycosylase domain-containing protein [Caldimonas sp.]